MRVLGMALLIAGMASLLAASFRAVPEIDPGSAGTALALLSGSLLVLKSRK